MRAARLVGGRRFARVVDSDHLQSRGLSLAALGQYVQPQGAIGNRMRIALRRAARHATGLAMESLETQPVNF
eukprot:7560205-Pyramimonas_sp.AAC.1